MAEWQNQFNPFNSAKLFAHVERWGRFRDGVAPPPVLVTVDPINKCNLACPHCNSASVRDLGLKLDVGLGKSLAAFLKQWGVRAVCVAGGGEPLLHGAFIGHAAEAGLKVGVVTNGILIDDWIETLRLCEWVGVSVDAGTRETYGRLKGRDCFNKIIRNISQLSWQFLGHKGRGAGVFYKYLILPGNEHEISEAAAMAKLYGCKGFHARPVGLAHDCLDGPEPELNVPLIQQEAEVAQSMEDVDFSVYIVTHKFGPQLQRWNNFKQCWGCMMTMVITPAPDGFNIDLCCDRRGDKKLRLAENLTEPVQIIEHWNTAKHWNIQKSIDPQQCPRCTYGPHARLVEGAVLADNTTYDFI